MHPVREALHPKLRDRLAEVDRQLAGLRLLRQRLVTAASSVGACPDSVSLRRSECMLVGSGRIENAAGDVGCGGEL